MPTKSLKKQPGLPVVRFYMAEDFRDEKDGKVSAIGLYADLNVVLQMPTDHPDPTPERPAVVRSLSFLFSITNAPASASISIDLQTPSGTKNVVASQTLLNNGGAANVVVRMEPCVVTVLGKRTFTVTVNQQKIKFDCFFGRQTLPIGPVTTNPSPAKVSPKSRAK
jgi:hypothetical protein